MYKMGTRTTEARDALDAMNKIEQVATTQQDKAKQLTEAYSNIFNTEQGKLILADMKAKCNYGYTAFSIDSARMTDFTLGKQASVMDIHAMMNRHKG